MGVTTGVEAPREEAEAEKPASWSWERPAVKLIVWITTALFCVFAWIEFGRVVVAMIRNHS